MALVENRFNLICNELNLRLSDAYQFKAELNSIYDHLIQIIGNDTEAISAWMHNPKKALNNRIPQKYLDTQDGIQIILKLLRKELEMDSVIG